MIRGDKAPFTGTLLDDLALAKLLTACDAQVADKEIDVEVAKRNAAADLASCQQTCGIKLKAEDTRRAALLEEIGRLSKLLLAAQQEVQKTPWYKSPYVNFLVGGILTGTVCILSPKIN